jgi:hypothetical protein
MGAIYCYIAIHSMRFFLMAYILEVWVISYAVQIKSCLNAKAQGEVGALRTKCYLRK